MSYCYNRTRKDRKRRRGPSRRVLYKRGVLRRMGSYPAKLNNDESDQR